MTILQLIGIWLLVALIVAVIFGAAIRKGRPLGSCCLCHKTVNEGDDYTESRETSALVHIACHDKRIDQGEAA